VNTEIAVGAAVLIIVGLVWIVLQTKFGGRSPAVLQVGQPLPDFHAVDEQGNPVSSAELVGTATVMLFVRGNWCPFCSAQVENLTAYYKNIVDLGGRLIFVTPLPLETTRRVAEFFDVEFDFWLDESLAVATQLQLLNKDGVPVDYRKEYGSDTVWPTAVVVDRAGIIRFTERSKNFSDRPDPQVLLRELKKAIGD
jgi:peroxiredoxin